MRDEFQRRRDVFVAGLNKIKGFSCRMPKGAFYAPQHHENGLAFEETGYRYSGRRRRSPASGTAFGDFGEGYLRFSVANSLENPSKALIGLAAGLERICNRQLRLERDPAVIRHMAL
jgi:aspartate/methionine/tyrosine aminotransferase